MSYRILHILDCYLPETMNWLEKLLEESSEDCEHHVFASFYIRKRNERFHYVEAGQSNAYPIPFFSKLKNKLLNSSNEKILLHYVLKHKIQIIHFHFGHVAIQYKEWIQKTGLPFCISLYGFDYEYLVHKNSQVKSDYVYLSKLGGRFIVEGNYSRRLVNSYGVPQHQIHIVHMLFGRMPESLTHEVHVGAHSYNMPIKLFQAATYTEKKNQLGLIEALQDRHASRFIISFYGEKVDTHYYHELIRAIRTKNKHCITTQDKISFEEYLKALANAHFAVNLSKRSKTYDTEGGCPVLLKDGLSMGKPGISTKHCDIPELIVHGCNGFLLPENDTPAVTELLDQLLLLSQKEYNSLCGNARESVRTNIHQEITRLELIAVYKNMS